MTVIATAVPISRIPWHRLFFRELACRLTVGSRVFGPLSHYAHCLGILSLQHGVARDAAKLRPLEAL